MNARVARSAPATAPPAFGGGPPVVFARGAYPPLPQAAVLRRETAPRAEEVVWGFPVRPGMCACRREVAQAAADARMLAAASRGCDVAPTNRSADAVDACARAAVLRNVRAAAAPGTPVAAVSAGSTGLFGPIRCGPQPPGPCGDIAARACWVHETYHDRQRRALGAQIGRSASDRARGQAFSAAYRRAAGEADEEAARARISRAYPEQYRDLVMRWSDGSVLARSEVEAYTRQGQFLADVGRALGRICR